MSKLLATSSLILALALVLSIPSDAQAGRYDAAWCNSKSTNASGGGIVSASPDVGGLADNATNVVCQKPLDPPLSGSGTHGMGTKQQGGTILNNNSKGWLWSAPVGARFIAFAGSMEFLRVGQGTLVCATVTRTNGTHSRQCITSTGSLGTWFSGCERDEPTGSPSTVTITGCKLSLPNAEIATKIKSVWVGLFCSDEDGCRVGGNQQFVRIRSQRATIIEGVSPSASSITGDLFTTRFPNFSGNILVPTTGRVKCEVANTSNCGSKVAPLVTATDTGAGVNGISYSVSTNGGKKWGPAKVSSELSGNWPGGVDPKYQEIIKRNCTTSLSVVSACAGSVSSSPVIALSKANGFNLNGENRLRACAADYKNTNVFFNFGIVTCGDGKSGKIIRTWTLDNKRPELISWSKQAVSTGDLSATYTMSFSEPIAGLLAADLSNSGVLATGSCVIGVPFAVSPQSGYSKVWSFDVACSEDASGFFRPKLAANSVYDSSSVNGVRYDGTGWTGPNSDATYIPVPPKTNLLSKPRKRTKSRYAAFIFESNQALSTFECRRDNQGWRSCSASIVYRKLRPGRHVFFVRATSDGVTGPQTAYRWRVLPRKR